MNTNTAKANRQMTQDEVAIFVMLSAAAEDKVRELFSELKNQDGGWVLTAIEKRFNAYAIQADKKTMIMTLTMGDGVVGKCAKYVDDMVHWCKENMISKLDFDIFNKRIYPNGFPNF